MSIWYASVHLLQPHSVLTCAGACAARRQDASQLAQHVPAAAKQGVQREGDGTAQHAADCLRQQRCQGNRGWGLSYDHHLLCLRDEQVHLQWKLGA